MAVRADRLRKIVCAALAFGTGALVSPVDAAQHAVVLVYHHVSNSTPRSTSVSPERFEQHLDYLAQHDFVVLALEEIVDAFVQGDALPPGAVALTFDDAYASVYQEALPRLERRDLPFTVFVATDPIDNRFAGFMDWDQLRDLESRGGRIGNHSADHAHLLQHEPDESLTSWQERIRANILRAEARLEQELDDPAHLFAYPYGEFDEPLEDVVAELGYVAFGQQSGPIGPDYNRMRLPRFPVATGFDDLDSLAEKLISRPLPINILEPDSTVLPARSAAPALRLSIPEGPYRRGDMRCYIAGQAPALIEWQAEVATIRARAPLGPGRSKYNCTVPARSDPDVFYWYSQLWIQRLDDGSWPAD